MYRMLLSLLDLGSKHSLFLPRMCRAVEILRLQRHQHYLAVIGNHATAFKRSRFSNSETQAAVESKRRSSISSARLLHNPVGTCSAVDRYHISTSAFSSLESTSTLGTISATAMQPLFVCRKYWSTYHIAIVQP